MTQKIKRKDLLVLYNTVCDSWKEEITKLVLFQTTNDIEIEEELIIRAYNDANSNQKELLNKYFKIKNKINTKNIKSFDDILKLANINKKDCLIFKNPSNKNEIKINAYNKLLIISNVLNEGWETDFTNSSQYKFYPYFKVSDGGLVYYDCSYYFSGCVAEAVFYKSSDIAKFAGTIFINEYNEFLSGIIV